MSETMNEKRSENTENDFAKEIVNAVAENFRTFGGGKASGWGNPLAIALKDTALQFAAGVDVREVVEFILAQIESRENL